MKMKNIRVEWQKENYIVVKADTLRFGDNAIMFEGNTFEECFNYIKRETGKNKLYLTSTLLYEVVKDRVGRQFPWYIEVSV